MSNTANSNFFPYNIYLDPSIYEFSLYKEYLKALPKMVSLEIEELEKKYKGSLDEVEDPEYREHIETCFHNELYTRDEFLQSTLNGFVVTLHSIKQAYLRRILQELDNKYKDYVFNEYAVKDIKKLRKALDIVNHPNSAWLDYNVRAVYRSHIAIRNCIVHRESVPRKDDSDLLKYIRLHPDEFVRKNNWEGFKLEEKYVKTLIEDLSLLFNKIIYVDKKSFFGV